MAQRFDAGSCKLRGAPIAIGDAPPISDVDAEPIVSASENGTLVLHVAPPPSMQLAWLDRSGAPAGNYPGTDLEVWNTLASIPAVRNRHVHALIGDHVVVAGPRLAQGAEAMARVLHADAYK